MIERRSSTRKAWRVAKLASTLAATLLLPVHSNAAEHSATGSMHFVKVHAAVHGTNVDWIGIAGVEQLGSCPAYNGYVVFRIKDDAKGNRMYALSVASKVSGEPVTVVVDDSLKDAGGGWCFLSAMY